MLRSFGQWLRCPKHEGVRENERKRKTKGSVTCFLSLVRMCQKKKLPVVYTGQRVMDVGGAQFCGTKKREHRDTPFPSQGPRLDSDVGGFRSPSARVKTKRNVRRISNTPSRGRTGLDMK